MQYFLCTEHSYKFLTINRFEPDSEFATVYHNDKDIHALPTSLSMMANAISWKTGANIVLNVMTIFVHDRTDVSCMDVPQINVSIMVILR